VRGCGWIGFGKDDIMTVYFGCNDKDFKISPFKKSRYGFKALFFATDIDLAKQYAIYHAKDKSEGYVYQADVPDNIRTFDYGGGFSYDRDFRNLMFEISQMNLPAARITNVIDFPKGCKKYVKSDVVVVFDLGELELKLV